MNVTLASISLDGLELAMYTLLKDINLDGLEGLGTLEKAQAVANLLIKTGEAMDKLIALHEDNF